MSIESTVKAYQAVQQAAVSIGSDIKRVAASGSLFVILGPNDVSAITALSVFEAQAALITKRLTGLEALHKSAGLAVPTADAEGGTTVGTRRSRPHWTGDQRGHRPCRSLQSRRHVRRQPPFPESPSGVRRHRRPIGAARQGLLPGSHAGLSPRAVSGPENAHRHR